MRTNIPEKLLGIIHEIDQQGSANLTRLTVLKKWFEQPERLRAFAIWVAKRATSRKGKTAGEAAELFHASQAVLTGLDFLHPEPDRATAQELFRRLRKFQDEYHKGHRGPVREIRNRNLLLIEKSLAIVLDCKSAPAHGYQLAADYCRHHDPRYGEALHGPSRTKIGEIVRFMFNVEALEDFAGEA